MSDPLPPQVVLPELLYHYTNTVGLMGILKTQTLWATDSRFMNDSLEMVYARDLAIELLETLRQEALDAADDQTVPLVAAAALEIMREWTEVPPVHVACFCADGDLLGQWRGYGGEQGFAIGLDPVVLSEIEISGQMSRGKPRLVQVVYGLEESRTGLERALGEVGKSGSAGHFGVDAWHRILWFVAPELSRIKHPSFRAEAEWRLVYAVPYPAPDTVAFRASRFGVVPYIEFPLPPRAVKRIVLGPGQHLATREQGVRSLLLVHMLEEALNIEITHSTSPLRGI